MAACHGCGVELDPRDRYCPYCHTPSPEARLKPAFAPSDRITAGLDEIDSQVLADGEQDSGQRCPRCERIVGEAAGYCSGCGMALDGAGARAGWIPPAPGDEWPTGWGSEHPVWPGKQVEEIDPFVDTDGIAVGLKVCLGVLGGLALMGAAASISWQRSIVVAKTDELSGSAGPEAFLGLVDVLGVMALVSTMVVFAIWTARAYRNLPALGARGMRWTPNDTLVAWLVPVVNFRRPYEVVGDLWRASDPSRALHPSAGWRRDPTPVGLKAWWISALATALVLLGNLTVLSPDSVSADWAGVLALTRLLEHVIQLGAAVLGFILVGDVVGRQRGRAEAIGWPAMSGYRIPAAGSRLVNPKDVGPTESEFRRTVAVTSGEVAGKY